MTRLAVVDREGHHDQRERDELEREQVHDVHARVVRDGQGDHVLRVGGAG